MPQPLGYAFSPTFDNAEMGKRGGSPPANAQQALQTLSFRLPPRVAGAARGGLSPLQGQGMAGSSIGQAVLQSVLRTVLGADADYGGVDSSRGTQQSPFGAMSGASGYDPGFPSVSPGSPPNPVIHPGGGDGRERVGDDNQIPRGTADSTHDGLQQWLEQAMRARERVSDPSQMFTGNLQGAGRYMPPWLGQR